VQAQQVHAQQVATKAVSDPNFAAAVAALNKAEAAGNSKEAQQLRTKLMGMLDNLSNAPDRLELAADALRIQRELTAPQWQQDLRHVGAQAAALGRIGSGMTTNELTDLTLAREKALGLFGQQLANQASGQILDDRLNIFGAGAGLQNQFAGQDAQRANLLQGNAGILSQQAQAIAANQQQNAARALQAAMANQGANLSAAQSNQGANLQADLSNAQRAAAASQARASMGLQQAGLFQNLAGTSAGMATNTAQFNAQQAQAQQQAAAQRAQLQQALLGQLAGIQGQTFNQGMSEAQLRTQQQQWQNQLQQQGVQNAAQQQVLQDQLLNSEFQRRLALAQAQGQYGFGNDPYSLQLAGSQYTQQNANQAAGGAAALAQQNAFQQAMAAASAARGGAPTQYPQLYGQRPGTSFYGS
jgi:hypothetical protein